MPTLQQVTSFLRAVISGKDKTLQAQRDAICNACDQYVERPKKNIFGKWIMQGFCKACGCGTHSMADMKRGKNALRKTKCPLHYWPGDAESMGLTLKEVNGLFGARDRLEYNLAAVQNLIDKGKPMDQEVLTAVYGQQIAQQIAQNNAKIANAGANAGRAKTKSQGCCHSEPTRIPKASVDKTLATTGGAVQLAQGNKSSPALLQGAGI